MRAKYIFPFLIVLILLFWGVGYALSDDYFFYRLIADKKISTPEKALEFVCNSTSYAKEKPISGLTPIYLLRERKYLYCDEGAVLLATIVHELGFATRLVDLANNDSTTRHTVLEVMEDQEWVTYDTVQRIRGASYHELIEGYESEDWRLRNDVSRQYKICTDSLNHSGIKPQYRQYPKLYNWLVQNNYFIKHTVLWLRGIPG